VAKLRDLAQRNLPSSPSGPMSTMVLSAPALTAIESELA